MNTGASAKEPGGNHPRVVQNEQFIAVEEIRKFCESPVLQRAPGAVQKEEAGSVAAVQRPLRDLVRRQVVVELFEAHKQT